MKLDKGGLAYIKENNNLTFLNLFYTELILNYGGILYILGKNCNIIAKNILCVKFTVKESGGIVFALYRKHEFKFENIYASEIIILSERGILFYSEFDNKISSKNIYFNYGLNRVKSGFIVMMKNNTLNLYNVVINNVTTKEEGGLLLIEEFNFLNIENIYIQNLNSKFSSLGFIKIKNSIKIMKGFFKKLFSEGIDGFHFLENNEINFNRINFKFILRNYPLIFFVENYNKMTIINLIIIANLPKNLDVNNKKCNYVPSESLSILKEIGFLIAIVSRNMVEINKMRIEISVSIPKCEFDFFKNDKLENFITVNEENELTLKNFDINIFSLTCKEIISKKLKLLASNIRNQIIFENCILDFSKISTNVLIIMRNTSFLMINTNFTLIQESFISFSLNSTLKIKKMRIKVPKILIIASMEFILSFNSQIFLNNVILSKIHNEKSSFLKAIKSEISLRNSQIGGFKNVFKNGSIIFAINSNLKIFKSLILLKL